MPRSLASSTYRRLVADIGTIYEQTRTESAAAVSAILVKAYWEIGRCIVEVEQSHSLRADYGSRLIERLSRDLTRKHGMGFSETNLKYMRQFYLAYPIRHICDELRWSHYRVLSSIKEDEKRQYYEDQAIQQDWNTTELRMVLREDDVARIPMPDGRFRGKESIPIIAIRRGQLYTYKVIEAAGDGEVLVDLGFNVWREVAVDGKTPEAGEIVESEKTGRGYRLKPSDVRKSRRYTYAALVERVVDGDTLWVQLDLGFKVWARRKLRLRGLDTPELPTQRGREAKAFVEETLKDGETVVIKTYGTDKYDRYLADVFYLPGEADKQKIAREGSLLNQIILDQRHAVAV